MKKTIISAMLLLLISALLFCLISCEENTDTDALWENASYLSDTTVGIGEKTVYLDIEAGEKKITVTLMTDKDRLGEAMFEAGLVNDSAFFNVLNGIAAIWEKDNAYWGFYQGENIMNYGINDALIEGGERYRFVYSK